MNEPIQSKNEVIPLEDVKKEQVINQLNIIIDNFEATSETPQITVFYIVSEYNKGKEYAEMINGSTAKSLIDLSN